MSDEIDADGGSPDPAHPPDSKLLEAMLQQTFAETGDNESTDPVLQDSIKRVRERYLNEPALTEDVARDLVLAVITSYFRIPPERSSSWNAVAKSVATTIYEDPIVLQRLNRLWESIRGRN